MTVLKLYSSDPINLAATAGKAVDRNQDPYRELIIKGGFSVLNKVILVGQLTHKPELEEDEFGKASTSFQLEVERNWVNSRGEREADYVTIFAREQTARNIVKYLQEGSLVAIEGSLNIDKFTDEDGNNRNTARVRAYEVRFLPGKGNRPQSERKPKPSEDVGEDELPF